MEQTGIRGDIKAKFSRIGGSDGSKSSAACDIDGYVQSHRDANNQAQAEKQDNNRTVG